PRRPWIGIEKDTRARCAGDRGYRTSKRLIMKHKQILRIWMIASIAAFCCFVLGSEPVLAQCVMCKASLSGNSSFVSNLNSGVLVLLVPPVSIFCTIFFLAFRHRKSG